MIHVCIVGAMCGHNIPRHCIERMENKRFFMIAMFLLVLGGLNWGYAAFYGRDLVSKFAGKKAWIVYGLVGLAALTVGFARDTYLPFLGPTVMPCSLLKDQIPEGADTTHTVQVKPGAKVLYWATEPSTEGLEELVDWRKAYLGFANAGVVTADKEGVATLHVRKPQAYTVPMKTLEPHIHYRVCGDNGMIGRVETVFLGQEAFVSSDEEMNAINAAGAFRVTKHELPFPRGTTQLMRKDIRYEYDVQPVPRPVPTIQTSTDTQITQGQITEFLKKSNSMGNFQNFLNGEGFEADITYDTPDSREEIASLGAEEEKRITQMDMNGLDESPQPAGAPYQTAFNLQ
jgi:uncharacterized membrane protein YuzA (DUF378 family)